MGAWYPAGGQETLAEWAALLGGASLENADEGQVGRHREGKQFACGHTSSGGVVSYLLEPTTLLGLSPKGGDVRCLRLARLWL